MANTYELEIYLDQKDKHVQFEQPIHHYIECDEYVIQGHLNKLTNEGFFAEHNNDSLRTWIPGRRVDYIVVKFLEKIQVIPDVTDSIKAALTEEE